MGVGCGCWEPNQDTMRAVRALNHQAISRAPRLLSIEVKLRIIKKLPLGDGKHFLSSISFN